MSLNKPIWKLKDWINKDKLDSDMLSVNPNAISLLEQNPDKINWNLLSLNPNAISLLEQNPDKINWFILSLNHNAIKILETNFKIMSVLSLWLY